MGNTCKPMAVSFQCMTKFTTNKKKKKDKNNYNNNEKDKIPMTLTKNVKIHMRKSLKYSWGKNK